MTNPTAGYSYNICVNDNDFGGACMKRLRFTADMTKEQKRNTVAKQWFRTSANTAFRATYPSPQAPTYATVSCTMCLHLCATKYPNIRAGFIHVPFACEQVVGKASTMASMPLETIAKSLEYCIEVVVTNKEEVKEAMGTTH